MMHLIDSHCHLDFEQFENDREIILTQCQQLGVKDIIVPAVIARDWGKLLSLCAQSKMLHPALGLHPLFMSEHKAQHLEQLRKQIAMCQVLAIGEIGLDFYLPDHDKEAQISLLLQQLEIAQHFELPILLHVRKAHDQTIHLLKDVPVIGGIVHAFNGSLQQAGQYQDLGFVFGVGGTVTHPRATRLRHLISKLPQSSLVLETDAPDMPLANRQGQRNTPENIPLIMAALAELRNESCDEVAAFTTENCKRVLNF